MAAGNLDLDVPGVLRNDELGTMASAVEIFRKNGLETRRLQAAAAASEKSEALAREALAKNEKLAALGGLVAGVAHEVNTPLGVAVTAASLHSEALKDIFGAFEKKQLTAKKFEEFFVQSNEVMVLVMRNLQRAATLISTFKKVSVDQTVVAP
jgi:signal transduction histidine kinase